MLNRSNAPGAAPAAPETRVAYISLGANLGDPAVCLSAALDALDRLPGVRVGAVSRFFRTEPQGFKDQPFFLNAAAALHCAPPRDAASLLDDLLRTETLLGRVRRPDAQRFGPRLIDLDLLLFGNQVMNTDRLILPHPRMAERAFVLVPLAEIAPDLVLPGGPGIGEALRRIAYSREGDVIRQS
ncbi:MAG: 2-amino-4-hydroxy-6-hydroxymethyldihydropteridine diphosphokinase [Desulfovibrio sp.]|jgi:2-amino-4-hydroxy-6-hydroxymethyldihydropteridine diphosphokinase|nr:2-amino-4-hydroxy-6-hydroxymethyldihydropteridine diphosphokinase [Desulfovibrio sp.]